MAIIIDHYQDSGPLQSGRGTTTTLINNVGWMNNGSAEGLTYADYPLIRPTVEPFNRSFTYFTFFKLSGTYVKGSRVRIKLSGAPIAGVSIFCRLTDTYVTPTANFTGDLTYFNPTNPSSAGQVFYPRISTTGPNANLNYLQYLAGNTTYYTEYLETQVYVKAGTEYNNIVLNLKCYVDEYEEDDL